MARSRTFRDLPSGLSEREFQVTELLCEGRSNPDIGKALGLSPGTVKEYLARVFKKAGVSNRTALAVWFVKTQTVPVSPTE